MGGYLGEKIRLDECLDELQKKSELFDWASESLPISEEDSLLCLERSAEIKDGPVVFISAGIHGDEPATTSAVARMILNDLLPRECSYTVFPCLNPRGMRTSCRETPNGKDLNRDFLRAENIEVQTEIKKLHRTERFDAAVLLHEDWEANGFYVYELTKPDAPPRFGRKALEAVSKVCPIEKNERIEGLQADQGLIHPPYHLSKRTDWPEAFYLMHHKTDHALTLESPSDFELEVRIQALCEATLAVTESLINEKSINSWD